MIKYFRIDTIKLWLPLIIVFFACFMSVTNELLPLGMLSEIAGALNKDLPTVGLIISTFAWIVSIASIPLALFMIKYDQRRLLLISSSVLVLGSLAAAVSLSFNMLLFARIFSALAHASFWCIVPTIALSVVSKNYKHVALSFVSIGANLGSIMGGPLSLFITNSLNWRMSFVMVSILSLIVLIAFIFILPKKIGVRTKSSTQALLSNIVKKRKLILFCVIALFVTTGHFTIFTYLIPLMKFGGHATQFAAIIMILIGISYLLGNILITFIMNKYPISSLILSFFILTISLFTLRFSYNHNYLLWVTCVFWGISLSCILLVVQTRLLTMVPYASILAQSGYSGIYNLGVGLGAYLGSCVIKNSNLEMTTYAGAGCIFLALTIYCCSFLLVEQEKIKTLSYSKRKLRS